MKIFLFALLALFSVAIVGCSKMPVIMPIGGGSGSVITNSIDCPTGAYCEMFAFTDDIARMNTTDYDNTPIMWRGS